MIFKQKAAWKEAAGSLGSVAIAILQLATIWAKLCAVYSHCLRVVFVS